LWPSYDSVVVIKITARIAAAARLGLNVQGIEIEELRRCSDDGDDGDPAACESTNRHRNRKITITPRLTPAASCRHSMARHARPMKPATTGTCDEHGPAKAE
jgi:hypothetical protein